MTEKDVPDPGPDLPDTPRPPVLQMDGIRIATLVILGCLVISSIFQGVYTLTSVREQRVVNECYQTQVDQLLSAILVGRQVTAQDRAAQLAMLNTVLDPGSTQESRRTAVESWRQALVQGDQTRSSAPVPTQRCAR